MDKAQIVLEIILLGLTLIGVVYKVAQSERRIYDAIDAQKDFLNDRCNSLEKRLDLQILAQENRKEFVDYRMNATDKLIDHKAARLLGAINDIQGYLERTGTFRKRETYNHRSDDE